MSTIVLADVRTVDIVIMEFDIVVMGGGGGGGGGGGTRCKCHVVRGVMLLYRRIGTF